MFKKVFSTSTVLLLAASTSSHSVAAVEQKVEEAPQELGDLAEELGNLVQELEDLAKDESAAEEFPGHRSPMSAPSTNSQPSAPSAPSNDASSLQAKSSKSKSKSSKKSSCPDGDTDVFSKLVLAREAAIAFNGLFALGADDLRLDYGELSFICDLLDEAGLDVDFLPCGDSSGKSGKGGSSVNVDDVTAGLFLSWEDSNYCASEVKDILDGTLPTPIAGYNAPFVFDDDGFRRN